MTSKIKRFLSMALTVLMLMTLMPATVLAEDEVEYVAKIGDQEFSTFAAAMTEANGMTDEVTVEIYGEVEFVDGMELQGSYSKINFIGMTDGAKITINQSAGGDYLEASGKTVTFKKLKLAKANPGWSGNAAHMGHFFSVHQNAHTTYTNCTFLNGACTSQGTGIYNSCTFLNNENFGLWVYNNAKVTVNGGKIDSIKGIKLYGEGQNGSTLTATGVTFTSKLTKPAVAISRAASVTLLGNIYNNATPVIELDSSSDGNSNSGVRFTAKDSSGNDIAATLTAPDRGKSNALRGVLVDGKIYSDIEIAIKAAKEGDTITPLYNAEIENQSIPAGITLNLNGKTLGKSGTNTLNISGNVTIEGEGSVAGTITLTDENTTLNAPEGLNVVTNVDGLFVASSNGIYSLVDADATFAVTFNSNNGSGSMDPQTFNVGAAQALSANKFTRSGYTFKGWNTKADGTGTAYANGASFTTFENVTLYAQWEKNPSYTVTFDPNGGEGDRTTQTFTEGVSQALNANTFTRKNFYFTGWMDDDGRIYSNKEVIQVPGNITLYAQWARVPSTTSYTVQYNANGGTGSVYLQAFTSSMTFNLRMNEFVREGYKFVGWNTKADGTGDAYAEGASFSGAIKKSIVLYAQWKLDVPEFPAVRPEYKIEVEGQEGKITRLNDTSIVFDEMFIRWSIGFDTVDGPFAMIAILDVTWVEGQEGLVGTFTIPVVQTNGTISGVNYMLTTDPNANMVGVGEAAANMYGMLIK